MKISGFENPDLLLVEPEVFGDERGFFYESFNKEKFDAAVGRPVEFVQDNHSKSAKGVLRGLHYQLPPHAQGKLVRVVKGAVFDVAVDIRRSSPFFGKWQGVVLSAENKKQFWIPEGFAHGFLTLTDDVEFLYKTTSYYAPESDRNILWNDSNLGIEWGLEVDPVLSSKDQFASPFLKADCFG
ncbi:dTDP-4-dehydrorhamnose 3,5-epimerase [Simiduia sp. 21SJ11W-1]|uniref:dTDP-4-dehydrorhamnose 3,5-epimerase n=1 Tax=Simiduia sp. 21SJ11W-1 TaxID=2909669 RepID=UPI00209E5DB1|nr:dTDP-4-dehydrorhamnose 3,5-epimerase [Simiduia sp. 21SJ11W-1]UTA49537.1 dTDP-4-dehydrorhamnose 3,5-epimerase [Simiduia sp. 21SJ11W-1]